MDLIEDIVDIYDNYDFDTEVLVASIRSTQHVIDAAVIGAHVSTLPLTEIPYGEYFNGITTCIWRPSIG